MNEKRIEEEVKTLKRLARKEKDPRMKIRYDAVRLNFEKCRYVEITRILDLTYQTVSAYVKSYKELGVTGLLIKEKTGRTKK